MTRDRAFLLICLFLLPAFALAEERPKDPVQAIRTLRSIQDRVAQGSSEAYEVQKQYLAELNEQMGKFDPEVWKDPRNARAAIFFVLSGGDPKLLRDLLNRGSAPAIDERLLKGALAYAEGQSAEAAKLLDGIEARALEPSMGGLVALVQGTLLEKLDTNKAIALLDDARLLSPGTLIEESALRREILLVARGGDLERFDRLHSQYARRFRRSIYGASFRREILAGVARREFGGASEWITRIEGVLEKLGHEEQREAYLVIAEEAVAGGNADIARYAAGRAAKLAPEGSVERERARLYEGTALIVSDEFDKGLSALQGAARDKLSASDTEILESALALAGQIRKWPATPAGSSDPMPASVTRAQSAISAVDSLLGEGVQ
ncbi:MAG TPA: chemotaxis protein [Hyphomicrobiaceae bacterium]|nr:chemotaxis protein [Hyphomicrobiaceae bacterium]